MSRVDVKVKFGEYDGENVYIRQVKEGWLVVQLGEVFDYSDEAHDRAREVFPDAVISVIN